MSYQFTRGWGQASVVVGGGVFVVALLLASWLGFSGNAEFERFSTPARLLAALVVALGGLIVGGTMHETLTTKVGAGGEPIRRS